MYSLFFVILIGIGATAIMDFWSLVRKQLLNIPPTNWGIVGRWLAYMTQGQFKHETITTLAPISRELLIGWVAHYLIGIAYAAILVFIYGEVWINSPTIGPALTVGIATVMAPFFIMQPCMGAGIAASRTPAPNSARLHSLINHAIFGLGLYLSGLLVTLVYPI